MSDARCESSLNNYAEPVEDARWKCARLPLEVRATILEMICGLRSTWKRPSVAIAWFAPKESRVVGYNMFGVITTQLYLDKLNFFMGDPNAVGHKMVCIDKQGGRMWVAMSDCIGEFDWAGCCRKFIYTPPEMYDEEGCMFAVKPTGIGFDQAGGGPGEKQFVYVRLGRAGKKWGIKYELDGSAVKDKYLSLNHEEVQKISFAKEHKWRIQKNRTSAIHRETLDRIDIPTSERIIEILPCRTLRKTHVYILFLRAFRSGFIYELGLYDFQEEFFEWKVKCPPNGLSSDTGETFAGIFTY